MNDLRTALSNLVKNCVLPTAGNEQFQQAVDDARAALAQPDPVEVREGWEYMRAKGLLQEPGRAEALKQAGYTRRPRQLPEEDEPEPVAYLWQHGETGRTRVIEKDQVWTASNQWNRVGPLYLHPPQRKPLTEEEIEQIADGIPVDDFVGPTTWHLKLSRAIEQAHGIGGHDA